MFAPSALWHKPQNTDQLQDGECSGQRDWSQFYINNLPCFVWVGLCARFCSSRKECWTEPGIRASKSGSWSAESLVLGWPITSPPLGRVESWHCRSTGTATWTEPLPTVCQNIPSGASTTRTLPTPSHLATTSGNVAVEGTWCPCSSVCHWQLW